MRLRQGFPGGVVVTMQETGKGSVLGSGRSPGGGHGHPPQYSCLENPMDREPVCGLQSMGSQRVRHKRSNLAHARLRETNTEGTTDLLY